MKHYCTFYVGGQYYGVEIQEVQEVIRCQAITRIPSAPLVVRGLINLRGQTLVVLDLRQRFSLPSPMTDPPFTIVIVRDSAELVGLLVDKIGNPLQLEESSFAETSGALEGVARDCVLGACQGSDRLLWVLSVEKIFQGENAHVS